MEAIDERFAIRSDQYRTDGGDAGRISWHELLPEGSLSGRQIEAVDFGGNLSRSGTQKALDRPDSSWLADRPAQVPESIEDLHGRKWGKDILSDRVRSPRPSGRRAKLRTRFRSPLQERSASGLAAVRHPAHTAALRGPAHFPKTQISCRPATSAHRCGLCCRWSETAASPALVGSRRNCAGDAGNLSDHPLLVWRQRLGRSLTQTHRGGTIGVANV